jgi:hypothetical protein
MNKDIDATVTYFTLYARSVFVARTWFFLLSDIPDYILPL